MGEFLDLIDTDEFSALIKDKIAIREKKTEIVPFIKSRGRILAENLNSPEDLPPFSRSSVDGYAVKSTDVAGASESMPVFLEKNGEVAMGKEANCEVETGTAVSIPTGGMLPEGADAIVMVEYTEMIDDQLISINGQVAPGENVIKQGEDIKVGQPVLKKGCKISARHIGAMAALGICEVEVYKRPQVAVISTGDELIDPRKKPAHGEIRDINSYTLKAMLEEIGAEVYVAGIVKDQPAELVAMLKELQEYDLILISGGSSVGLKDMTIDVLNSLANPGVLVHGVAIKPGKPTIFAMLDNQPVFGLPGHPASSWNVSYRFVREAVDILLAKKEFDLSLQVNYRSAILTRNIESDRGREEYIPVSLNKDGEKLRATPIPGKSSLITILAEADGYLVAERYQEGFNEGERVKIIVYN